ncbi:MAG: histone deacetylase family protein [Pseudomonadales bacterium]|nr:histone deacetylase family protein [Pseudomonadales bacterium]
MDFYTHSAFLDHRVPVGHPERPERLDSLLTHLKSVDLWPDLNVISAPRANVQDLARVHTSDYVAAIKELSPTAGFVQLDPDTAMSPGSLEAATRAAGAVCSAVRRIASGGAKRAFCAVRPPGHHAESSAVLGFCLFNSVAVAADVALESFDRIAVLDFDVHHCNGTVEMFADRPEVLVCSTFQYPFYPGRFQTVERPNVVNCRMPAGSGSDLFRELVESEWIPAIEDHEPGLILVSAGFDAHRADPLAQINLEDEDFRWISETIASAADRVCGGRIVSTLEGGYALDALSRCVEIHLATLL